MPCEPICVQGHEIFDDINASLLSLLPFMTETYI